MQILIQDTYSLYKEMINLPQEERTDFFKEKLMEPFHPMYKLMNMPISPEMLGSFPLTNHDDEIEKMLIELKNADVWNQAKKAIEDASKRFIKSGIPVPEKVVLGIFLGNPEFLSNVGGYTGIGSFPGYIQVIIVPNEYNLPRLKALIAHEFHHNVLFYNAKWNFMNVSLAKYLAVEGLAESFAKDLYGEEYIGPWVTGISKEDLEKGRNILRNHLNVTGFNEVRKYIFGDQLMHTDGVESTGIPALAGYSIGYHAVQAFLKNTGISIEEATVIDGETIMEKSSYFN